MLAISVSCVPPATAEKPEIMRVVADVALPGPVSRFDYQSFDPTDGRLYIAHMNADQLEAQAAPPKTINK